MSLFTTYLTVQPWMTALEHRDGVATTVLAPGRHPEQRRATYTYVDMRERLTALPVQEVPTADGLTVKASGQFRWRVADPLAFTEVAVDAPGHVYAAVQVALRTLVAATDAEDVAARVREGADATLREQVLAVAERVGIDLLAVEVKDVVLPVELRHARAELVLGRYRAQAKLEEARAETAALRSLANGAKLLADNPALAQLRLVQALPPGSTVEVHTGQE